MFFRSVTLISLVFWLVSCAQQVVPTGGEKDEQPPRILEANPENESVGMLRSEIVLEFDEYVALKGANQQLIVSPPLKYPVEFKLRNKKLFVNWKDTLRENTTYLFQFGTGIVDVNEGNPLDSNIFVFSTGPYIDSFSIQGKVIDAFNLKPQKDIWVMLYNEDNDSLPYKELPRYFSKTDESGNFELKYLSQGDYKLFAMSSVNGGYLYDVPEEAIGFVEGLVPATYNVDSVDTFYNIRLFNEDDSTQYLKSFAQDGFKGLVLEFNRSVDVISVTDLLGNQDVKSWSEQWSLDFDSVTYWFPDINEYDSMKLKLEVDGYIDTLFLRKPITSKSKGAKGGRGNSKAKDTKPSLPLSPSNRGKQDHFRSWRLKSKTPIASIDGVENGLFIENDDTTSLAGMMSKEYYGLNLKYEWKEGARYKIVIPDSSITDRFLETNADSLVYSFTASQKEDFGQLYIQHMLPDNGHQFIWQLLNDKQDVIDERVIKPNGKITYSYLLTGKYAIRILYDSNNNGIWDTGYYPGKRQPEKTKYYDQPIEIRSNWATEIDWKLLK